jgi:hypothetical protein
MSLQSELYDAAARDMNDWVMHVTNVEGTPVFELRPWGDQTIERTWYSVNVNTVTPTTEPDPQ